ncbi:hypothetical protein MSP8887_01434 [Marinomonas spartinae]|nr:hypothetical protein MSP8887_01434 [Marinomonas spartinae]
MRIIDLIMLAWLGVISYCILNPMFEIAVQGAFAGLG